MAIKRIVKTTLMLTVITTVMMMVEIITIVIELVRANNESLMQTSQ